MTQLPPAIRKAAILVSTLDDRAADALLDQMGPEMAARVRNAMMELDEIPSDEQQVVLAEFLRGGTSGQSSQIANPADDGGVELDLSLAERIDKPLPAMPIAPPQTSGRRFDFLQSVRPQHLAEVLKQEQPQTIAVVVTQVDADLAAQLLEALSPALATDVLERMAWLDEPDGEVLNVLESQLRRDLAPHLSSAQRPQSLASLQAVLGAMEGSSRARVLESLATRNRSLSRQLGHGHSSNSHRTARANSEVTAFRYRLQRPDQAERQATPLVDFEDFATFSEETLRRVFAAAEPQVVLLALTGADESLLARILRQLPARAAATLRTRLNNPGAVRLRDIESAQQQLAELARQLAERGEIVLPLSRHFAAAA